MPDFFSLGSVQQSILESKIFTSLPENFDSVKKRSKWRLLDGGNIEGTDLGNLTQQKDIPDGRGVFIRGMNVARDPKTGDPERDRDMGKNNYQEDQVGPHVHLAQFKLKGGNTIAGTLVYGQQGNTDIGTWPVTVEPNDGVETRPRNIALYVYIKIYN